MDVLSTFQRSNKDSHHSFRRNKPVHFGGSLDFLYCIAFAITFMPHAWCLVQNVAVSTITFICAICMICLGTKCHRICDMLSHICFAPSRLYLGPWSTNFIWPYIKGYVNQRLWRKQAQKICKVVNTDEVHADWPMQWPMRLQAFKTLGYMWP